MLGIKVKTENQMARVKRSAEKAAAGNIFSAASLVMRSARDSIERAEGPSEAGTPPHTRRGQLPRAIAFHVDKQKMSAVIGPRESFVSVSAHVHEFGGDRPDTERVEDYTERAFMHPALERVVTAFAGSFRGSIGQ